MCKLLDIFLYQKIFVLFAIFFAIFMMTDYTYCFAQNWITDEEQQQLDKNLQTDLVQYWEKATGRTHVQLPLQFQWSNTTPPEFSITLAPRYRREMLLEATIIPTAAGSSTYLEVLPNGETVARESGLSIFACNIKGNISNEKVRDILQKHITKLLEPKELTWDWNTKPLAHGIVLKPVADLYMESQNTKGDNLASQALYGSPLIIWKKTADEKFCYVQQVLDGYFAWVEAQNIQCLPISVWTHWVNFPKRCIQKKIPQYPQVGTLVGYKNRQSWLWEKSSSTLQTISIPENCLASPIISFSTLALPKPTLHPQNYEAIITTAKRFLPKNDLGQTTYVWGGIYPPQLDCSGFVQLVFRLNGVLLPRDSDQQYQFATKIPQTNLQAGDLLFFSSHGKHPTHVGIYIGNNDFIHCSPAGDYSGVKINNLQGKTVYEQDLLKSYYGAGRIGLKK